MEQASGVGGMTAYIVGFRETIPSETDEEGWGNTQAEEETEQEGGRNPIRTRQ